MLTDVTRRYFTVQRSHYLKRFLTTMWRYSPLRISGKNQKSILFNDLNDWPRSCVISVRFTTLEKKMKKVIRKVSTKITLGAHWLSDALTPKRQTKRWLWLPAII